MSSSSWRKRSGRQEVTLPSGEVVEFRPPRPEIGWRHGKVARTFKAQFDSVNSLDGMSPEEKGIQMLEVMTPEQMKGLKAFADDIVQASVVSPQIRIAAKGEEVGDDEIEIEDVPREDYWYIFAAATHGLPERVVETKGGETSVADLESFHDEPPLPDIGANSPDLQSETVATHGAAG